MGVGLSIAGNHRARTAPSVCWLSFSPSRVATSNSSRRTLLLVLVAVAALTVCQSASIQKEVFENDVRKSDGTNEAPMKVDREPFDQNQLFVRPKRGNPVAKKVEDIESDSADELSKVRNRNLDPVNVNYKDSIDKSKSQVKSMKKVANRNMKNVKHSGNDMKQVALRSGKAKQMKFNYDDYEDEVAARSANANHMKHDVDLAARSAEARKLYDYENVAARSAKGKQKLHEYDQDDDVAARSANGKQKLHEYDQDDDVAARSANGKQKLHEYDQDDDVAARSANGKHKLHEYDQDDDVAARSGNAKNHPYDDDDVAARSANAKNQLYYDDDDDDVAARSGNAKNHPYDQDDDVAARSGNAKNQGHYPYDDFAANAKQIEQADVAARSAMEPANMVGGNEKKAEAENVAERSAENVLLHGEGEAKNSVENRNLDHGGASKSVPTFWKYVTMTVGAVLAVSIIAFITLIIIEVRSNPDEEFEDKDENQNGETTTTATNRRSGVVAWVSDRLRFGKKRNSTITGADADGKPQSLHSTQIHQNSGKSSNSLQSLQATQGIQIPNSKPQTVDL